MRKIKITVPHNVNYISEWENFEYQIPQGQVIINKKYPGCGLTTWALYNPKVPVVLCVPRIYLAENKTQQLDLDNESYFFFKPSIKSDTQKRKEENECSFQRLRNYLCLQNIFGDYKAPKVIVTYDSLPTIYPHLKNSRIDFLYVVDEHQASFQDYTLKPDVIERVSSLLYSLKRVWYISATPILEKYLDRMEFLNTLPYVELEWPKEKVMCVSVEYKSIESSTVGEITKIIQEYKRTGYFDTITENGICYDSTEAVFFINNVKDIINVIKSNGLSASEVNILVAHDSKNKKEIKKLGNNFGFGKIPLKGMPHARYTFCSKCSYFGVDFYSTSASTYIFADSNVKSMCTDLSLDLLQIVGRQRLVQNHFAKKCYVYVKLTKGDIMEKSVFEAEQESRWNSSECICQELNTLSQNTLSATTMKREICPYGVIFQEPLTGQYIAKNCINALIAEQHAWDMRNRIYTQHPTVQSLIIKNGFDIIQNSNLPAILQEFIEYFWKIENDDYKMKCYADFFDANPDMLQNIQGIPSRFYNYYKLYGTNGLMAYNYNMAALHANYQATREHYIIEKEVYLNFRVGERYSKESIKRTLSQIYQRNNIKRKAKSTDLNDFFDTKPVKITEVKNRVNGLLINNIK